MQARIDIMSDLAAWAPPQAIAAAAAPDPASAASPPSGQPAHAHASAGGALDPWGPATGALAQHAVRGLGLGPRPAASLRALMRERAALWTPGGLRQARMPRMLVGVCVHVHNNHGRTASTSLA